jgi:hypothetical protein
VIAGVRTEEAIESTLPRPAVGSPGPAYRRGIGISDQSSLGAPGW